MSKMIGIAGGEIKLNRLEECLWEIPRQGGMRVPGRIYATEKLLSDLKEDNSLRQVMNVAHLPGIVGYSLAMPDIHWGYGFPIGGVAAMDFHDGVISPGGVGYDINCGVRLVKTNLAFGAIREKIPRLVDTLFSLIPSGVGAEGAIPKLSKGDEKRLLREGARWAVEQGYGQQEDLDWGIEFTWTSGKPFNTTRAFDGVNTSDEFVLSVSVDRPTFFNFLNPNRSFFLNFQVFFRYLSDFDGSRDNRDGMYGSAEGPWSSFMTFFVMTGYFQDRLNPRLILVYDPTTSNGAAIVRVGYRWNDAFSSEIGYRSFFGHPARVERQYFPIVAITSPEQRFVEAFGRGVAPVRNRDSITFKLRYSF